MFEVLHKYLHKNAPLSEAEKQVIETMFIPRRLKKGEYLQREGDPVRHAAFVSKGFLRSYIIDQKGKEHIIQFAPEEWWISDRAGVTEGVTASFFIDAIEDTEALLIDLKAHLALLEQVTAYRMAFQVGMQKRAVAKDKRIADSLAGSAEQRYNDFLETYPSIARRVPQHMLASYLGITPETLSRIRRMQSRKR